MSDAATRAAVLFREASRSSRQWRTYAGRAAFSGALIAALLLALTLATTGVSWFGDTTDPATLGKMGRILFTGFAVIEVAIAVVIAPVVVARAVIEEQEDGTLDLVVLSRIPVRSILVGKVGSRLLTLMTVVLGATPILALVTTLGGVSVFEVLAVTLDTLAAMVILGLLGGFFALFTRSQVLATLAAVTWAIPTFLIAPWAYVACTFEIQGLTHLSPFYATWATDGFALLTGFAFIPTVWRTLNLAARVFEMRVVNARFGRLFGSDTWALRSWLIEGAIGLAALFTALPVAVAVAWGSGIATGGTGMFGLHTVATLVIWVWFVWAISWCTWLYLRLGAEWVTALDLLVKPLTTSRARKATVPLIGENPVLWHEVSWRAMGVWGIGLLLWLLALWAMFQSMLWLVPGGLLAVGFLNLALAWFGSAWLATSTIETERREGTLDLILTSTLPAWRIAVGKTLAVLLPTAPLMLIAAPLVALGVPHLGFVAWIGDSSKFELAGLLRGTTVAIWAIAFWLFIAVVAQILTLRAKKPQGAYAANLAWVGAMLIAPWMIDVAFGFLWPVRVVARLVMPITASPTAPWWDPLLPATVLFFAAGVGFVWMIARYRSWNTGLTA